MPLRVSIQYLGAGIVEAFSRDLDLEFRPARVDLPVPPDVDRKAVVLVVRRGPRVRSAPQRLLEAEPRPRSSQTRWGGRQFFPKCTTPSLL